MGKTGLPGGKTSIELKQCELNHGVRTKGPKPRRKSLWGGGESLGEASSTVLGLLVTNHSHTSGSKKGLKTKGKGVDNLVITSE